MQEYDENKAIRQMGAVLAADRRDEDAVCEVLDLIFDYYEENGDLEIDFDDADDADTPDLAAIVAFVSKTMAKNPPVIRFTDAEIEAMVRAEIAYEETLL